jgi:mono/diheme cytochrome c family protein
MRRSYNQKGIRLAFSVLVGFLTLLAVFSAVSSQEDRRDLLPIPDDPAAGFRLFSKKGCMECHAIGGYGGTAAQDLTKAVTEQSFYGIARMIWNHVPKMSEKYEEEKIPWPRVSSEEMADLMPFLSYLNFFDKPGDPEEGEEVLFRENCVICHRVGKVGIVKVKSLDEFKQYKSPVFFVTSFWNKGREVGEALRAEGLDLFEFQEDDLVDMIAYIKRSGLEQIEEKELRLPPPNPKNGQRVFLEKGCANCHPRAVTPREAFEGVALGPFTRIVRRMLNHTMWSDPETPEMPVTPEEMSDLVSYVYFLSYAGKTGDPESGKRLFYEKQCADCHGLDGKDGAAAPDLGSSSDLKSPMDVLSGMWNTAPEKMQKEMLEAGVPWPQFEERELADLFAYILSPPID